MIGETISHYRIVKRLGEGGMGVVYLAEDNLLGRQVAIKTLTAAAGSAKQNFRNRFLREAQAVSKLSHPHIATLHDYGETKSGQPYIVMEFVEGKTLSELIREESLTVPQTIQIICQVAEALSEAHRHGIVHRDIKPSNIAINDRGYVKVLDFGLAKQINTEAGDSSDSDQELLVRTQTRDGIIVGTPMYLSPEQALGLEIDARSDLFSLGSVLYECITARPAFSGKSDIDVCAKVIRDNPPAPSSIRPTVSLELDRITLRTLAKRPEDRYQTANDLIAALRTAESGLTSREVGESEVSSTRSLGHVRRFNNRLWSRSYPVLAILVFIGLVTIGWLLYADDIDSSPQTEQTRLAISGDVKEAAISPDGNYVAYIVDEAGLQSIWLRQITTATELVLVTAGTEKYKGLSFSPNRDYVYFLKEEGDTAALYKVSTLGGNSRRLAANVDTPVSFAPAGDRMTFVRFSKATVTTSLLIANSDGTDQRNLITLKEPQLFSRGGFYSSGPAWSPDGSVIAVPAFSVTDHSHREVVIVSVADGRMQVIKSQPWEVIEKVVWLADGRGFLMNAAQRDSPILQIWLVTYPGGQARRITKDPNDYIGMSTTKDSKTVLTTRTDRISSVWISSATPNFSWSQIPSSRYLGAAGISWTSDDKFVLASNTTGNYAIWKMDLDGTNRTQLTFDNRMNIEPAVSADGRHVVYVSFEARHPHLWRIDIDGSNAKQLTSGGDEDFPRFTPDSKWLVYHSINEDKYNIRKVSIDGGEPVVLVKDTATQPDVSPDGKLVACFGRPEGSSSWKILIVSIEGGPYVKTFDLPATVEPEWPGIRWSPDGLSLTYVATSRGVSNVWRQPLAGGEPKPITDFNESRIFFFDWSRSTRKLVLVRGNDTKDLVLVRNFLD